MSESIGPLRYPIIVGKPVPETGASKAPKAPLNEDGKSFQELLSESLARETGASRLTFSKHAQQRGAERSISLTGSDLERLEGAVEKAAGKGLGDTLIFMNNTAFIVNVPNRVVVTMVDGGETESTVFTNIDGAVIV